MKAENVEMRVGAAKPYANDPLFLVVEIADAQGNHFSSPIRLLSVCGTWPACLPRQNGQLRLTLEFTDGGQRRQQ